MSCSSPLDLGVGSAILLSIIGKGGRNRTLICGFGDRRSTTELHPHYSSSVGGVSLAGSIIPAILVRRASSSMVLVWAMWNIERFCLVSNIPMSFPMSSEARMAAEWLPLIIASRWARRRPSITSSVVTFLFSAAFFLISVTRRITSG